MGALVLHLAQYVHPSRTGFYTILSASFLRDLERDAAGGGGHGQGRGGGDGGNSDGNVIDLEDHIVVRQVEVRRAFIRFSVLRVGQQFLRGRRVALENSSFS